RPTRPMVRCMVLPSTHLLQAHCHAKRPASRLLPAATRASGLEALGRRADLGLRRRAWGAALLASALELEHPARVLRRELAGVVELLDLLGGEAQLGRG